MLSMCGNTLEVGAEGVAASEPGVQIVEPLVGVAIVGGPLPEGDAVVAVAEDGEDDEDADDEVQVLQGVACEEGGWAAAAGAEAVEARSVDDDDEMAENGERAAAEAGNSGGVPEEDAAFGMPPAGSKIQLHLSPHSTTGYKSVAFLTEKNKTFARPYSVQVWCGGKTRKLASFVTPLEAALFYAVYMRVRHHDAAAEADDQPAFGPGSALEAKAMEEARQMRLATSSNKSGYKGVSYDSARAPQSRYIAQSGSTVLGRFGTPIEAAVCYTKHSKLPEAPEKTPRPTEEQMEAENEELYAADDALAIGWDTDGVKRIEPKLPAASCATLLKYLRDPANRTATNKLFIGKTCLPGYNTFQDVHASEFDADEQASHTVVIGRKHCEAARAIPGLDALLKGVQRQVQKLHTRATAAAANSGAAASGSGAAASSKPGSKRKQREGEAPASGSAEVRRSKRQTRQGAEEEAEVVGVAEASEAGEAGGLQWLGGHVLNQGSEHTRFTSHQDIDEQYDAAGRQDCRVIYTAVVQLSSTGRSAMCVLGKPPVSYDGAGSGYIFPSATWHHTDSSEKGVWKLAFFFGTAICA